MASVRSQAIAGVLTLAMILGVVWWLERAPSPRSTVAEVATGMPTRVKVIAPKGWGKISASGIFSFYAPKGTSFARLHSDDSFLGTIKGPNFDLQVDLGQWSNDLSGMKSEPDYEDVQITIGGRLALIRTAGNEVGLFVPAIACSNSYGMPRCAPDKLEIHGTAADALGVKRAKTMFRSIEFSQ